MPDEQEIIDATARVRTFVLLLVKCLGPISAPDLLETLQRGEHGLYESLARAVVWLLLEQGDLKLGKSLKLETTCPR